MKNTFSLKELGRRALAVLLTIAMVCTSSPLAYAEEVLVSTPEGTTQGTKQGTGTGAPKEQEDARAEEEKTKGQTSVDVVSPQASAQGANEEAAKSENTQGSSSQTVNTSSPVVSEEVNVALSFDKAYIHYKGQAVALPTTTLKVPAHEDFEFAATADNGCTLSEVAATTGGTKTVIQPNESGFYVVPAKDVTEGLAISVVAKGDSSANNASTLAIEDKRNDKPEFVYEDADVKVTATLTDPAALPADVEFRVTPITKDAKDAKGNPVYNYDAYMAALNERAAEGVTYTPQNTLLYDVAFLSHKTDDKGNPIADQVIEVQLSKGLVHLDFQFKRNQLRDGIGANGSSKVHIEHLPLRDSVRSAVATTAEASNISASDIVVEPPLDQAANVDAEQMQLSVGSLSAFAACGVDEGASEPATSERLEDFLDKVQIIAPMNGDQYEVKPGAGYKIWLTFKERYEDGDTLQFADTKELTYTLPAGLEAANGHTGEFTINVTEGTETFPVKGNTYEIDGRVLKVRFNQQSENFSKLTAAANAQFSLWFEGSFTGSTTHIIFADGVERDLHIDNSHDVTCNKVAWVIGDQVKYTLTVTSIGNNTNVQVHDELSTENPLDSAALQLYEFETAKSQKPNEAQVERPDLAPTRNGNTFDYVIPQMSDGEVITIVYTAKIDPTKIDPNLHNGKYTIKGKNKVNVWGDGDEEPFEQVVETDINYNPSIEKHDPTITQEDGDSKTLEWTIVANRDPAISMAGMTIRDMLANECKSFMKYSGPGIHVVATDKDGNEAWVGDVPWDAMNVDINTADNWSYVVPNKDAGKAYTYTITFTTDVNLAGQTGAVTIKNYGQVNDGPTDSGETTGMPEGGEVAVHKEAEKVDYQNNEVTWNIQFNVPKDGLTDALVYDCYPALLYNGVTYPEPVKPESIVVHGLINNESYTVTQTQYENKAATAIQFYKSGTQEPNNKGLNESNEGRTIEITLKTSINLDLLELIQKNSELNYLTTHINTVALKANNNIKTDNDSVTIVPPDMVKKGTLVGYRTDGKVRLPVYKFEIVMGNVHKTDNVIVDRFDTSLLKFYEGEGGEAEPWFNDWYWYHGYVFGGNIYDQSYGHRPEHSPFAYQETDSGITITTNERSMPRPLGNPDGFFDKYRFVYYLTVKDEDALNIIKARALAANDGTYAMENVAVFDGQESKATVTYEYEGLKKELLTKDEDLRKTDEDIWPEFRLTINPEGAELNGGNPLIVEDTVSNLSVDLDSIQVTIGNPGNPSNPSSPVTWDMTGNTVRYTIPDKTKVVITYRARVLMTSMPAIDQSVNVHFSNRATMKGYDETVGGDAVRTNGGGGSASVFIINVMKYRAGTMADRLEGATFQLQDKDQKPVLKKDGSPVEVTTDENGKAVIVGDMNGQGWALKPNQKYYLEEIAAPNGFSLAEHKYEFTISEDGTTDYSHYIYPSGDIMTVKDYPGTDVRVLKEWLDGNDKHDADNVTVKLQQKKAGGEWSDDIWIEGSDGWQKSGKTLVLNKDNDWKGTFNKLPLAVPVDPNNPSGNAVDVEYNVVETKVNDTTAQDFEAVRSNEDSGTYVFTIKNNVHVGNLRVSKTVESSDQDDKQREFEFTIELSNKTISGTYGNMTFQSGKTTVYLKDGQSAEAENLPAGITYTVTEKEVNGFEVEKTDDAGTIEENQTKTASFTNTRKRFGDLSVKKVVSSNTQVDKSKYFDFTVELSDKTLGGDEGQTFGDMTFKNGVATFQLKDGEIAEATNLPAGITYTVTEESEDGFVTTKTDDTGTINQTKSEAVFTNTRDTGNLEVSKRLVSDAAADKDQNFTFTVELSDKTITQEYSNVSFTNGVATFDLKGGESKLIEGLPADVTYKVTEAQANNGEFTTEASNDEGKIQKDATAKAAFVNTRKTGALEVSKTVPNADTQSANATFRFRVELSDKTIGANTEAGKTYGDMTFKDGVATFELGNGQKATATGLPTDIGYTVTEVPAEGYTTTPAGGEATGTINDGTAKEEFVNTRVEKGSLVVSKTVVSALSTDHNKDFNFTVTLDDNSISGIYGDMEFTNGVAEFALKDNQTKMATGLPKGTGYTVTEESDNDFTSSVGAEGKTGTITDRGVATEAFVNTRKTGELEVSKTVVSDAAADSTKPFTFTVQLNPVVSGTFGPQDDPVTFDSEGKATLTLKGGESKRITGLPTTVGYTVTEAKAEGFTTEKTGDTGTISETNSTAAFTNTRETGDLVVSKAVVSNIPADKNQTFTFTAKLEGLAANKVNGTYGDMTFKNGETTVELKDNQSATATGLPTGITYTVTEATDSSAGYTVQKTGDTGTISTQGATAAFTNTRQVGALTIQKGVTVNGNATSSKVADGTYSFTVKGPGTGANSTTKTATVTITDGQTNTTTLGDLVPGEYTITENTGNLRNNMKLTGANPVVVNVEANNTQAIPVAEFSNNLRTTTANMQVRKVFNNWKGVKWGDGDLEGFAFKLLPKDGAPMPANTLVPNEDTVVVTGDEAATFGTITYTKEDTYHYTISEVVPTGAKNGVYRGIAYDTAEQAEHDVTVQVVADQSGALHATVTYDDAKPTLSIVNTYAAQGQTQIAGTKKLVGRNFRESDVWTFAISAAEEEAPMPAQRQVTVNAANDATIDFGTISGFDFDDVGKTYHYTITETGDVPNVVNDASKEVTVTVADNGDGTLNVTPSTNSAPLEFINTYQAKANLSVKKIIEGRDWKRNNDGDVAEEYHFKLYDKDDQSKKKRENSGVLNTATTVGDSHEANFGTFAFTTNDVGKTFRYEVLEDTTDAKPDEDTGDMVRNGVHYDNHAYDVTYSVSLDENNELKVKTVYERGGQTLENLEVTNTYYLDKVPVTIKAQKNLSGRAITESDQFKFALYFVSEDGKVIDEPEQVKTAVREDGQYRVTFDSKEFSSEVSENYIIREVVPQGATQNGEGVWVKDGISYDATDHRVRVVTTDEQKNGKLTARVYYDDSDVAYGEQNNTALPTFNNSYFGAEANISFDKEYYGANLDEGAFTFTMTATNESFQKRKGTPGPTKREAFVDDGKAELEAVFANGAFEGNTAKVNAPTVTYHQPGTYYYLITENAKDNVTIDAAQIRVTVTVGNDGVAKVTYVVDDGTNQVATDKPVLYNNEAIHLTFNSAALRATADKTSFTNFEPAVRKVMKNGVLRRGEFSFSLYEGEAAVGQPLDTASNDINGMVAFDMIPYGPSDVDKTYNYTIVENGDGVPNTITYDKSTIRLSVVVSQKDGAIVAEPTYTKFDVDGKAITDNPNTFVNEYDSIVIRTIKRSREEPHDPLPGAHYGLWMINPNGEDVYMGLGRNQLEQEGSKLESNDQGELYYDFPMIEGVAYYFLEEFPPPAGHLVDPYPTDYFTLVHDKDTDQFRIVYETDPLFAQKCPDVKLRD